VKPPFLPPVTGRYGFPQDLGDKAGWLKLGLGLCLISLLLYSLSTTTADLDLWGYLSFGRLFWEQGQFPLQDIFAYVPTLKLWVYHEWLTGVIFYLIYQRLGPAGLQALKYLLGMGAVLLVFLTARKRGASLLAAGLVLFMVHEFLTYGYSPVRAQVFTYFFFALTLYLLENARVTGRYRGLWLLVLIQIPWCNLHGGFIAGLSVIFLYALGEILSPRPFWPYYLGCLALGGLATLINPYGLDYWRYLLNAIFMPRPEIIEWSSVIVAVKNGAMSPGNAIYLATIIVFTFLLLGWARWREITTTLILGFTLYMGLNHIRHLVFFLIALGAYLPSLLTPYFETLQTLPRFEGLGRRLGWKIPMIASLAVMVLWGYRFLAREPLSLKIPPLPSFESKYEVYYPVWAFDYIKEHRLTGKLLISFKWGEYALWNLYPLCQVAIDGRYETVYPEAVALPYFEFIKGRKDWRRFLEQYPPDLILIDISSKTCSLLQGEALWRQVYADTGSALFVRSPDSRAATIVSDGVH
jgi:hypothetical protein